MQNAVTSTVLPLLESTLPSCVAITTLLAVTSAQREPSMPDLPTVGETVPGFEKPPSWFGYLAPGGTPQPVIMRLNSAIVKSLANPEVRKPLEEQALNIIASSPEQFTAMIKSGFTVYEKAIKLANLKPE